MANYKNIRLGNNHTGSIKDLSLAAELHKITVPTLIINGKDNEIQNIAVQPLFEGIPKAKTVEFMHSSHMPFLEERVRYMNVVGEFLTNVHPLES